jgi:hypothetical protein
MILLFYLLFIIEKAYLQCGSGVTVILKNQAEVNNFIANNCTNFLGNLIIDDSQDAPSNNINNLTALSALTNVGGNLEIKNNPNIGNVNGLSSLQTIGGNLIISNNPQLRNLRGLAILQSIGGDFNIINNPLLRNINGLRILNSITGSLLIDNNAILNNLFGLTNVNSFGGSSISITNCPKLDRASDYCGLYEILSPIGSYTGSYLVSGNTFNPSQTDIVNNGVCSAPYSIMGITYFEIDDAIAEMGDPIEMIANATETNDVVFPLGRKLIIPPSLTLSLDKANFTNNGTIENYGMINILTSSRTFINTSNSGVLKGNGTLVGRLVNNGVVIPDSN